MLQKKSGFTLLELIIVVIVIGILASIALPRYIRIAEKGRVAEAKSLLGAVRSAQMRYVAQHATYAADINLLDINMQTPKYYTIVAGPGGNIAADATVVAQATRAGLDNPGLGSYVINITASGTLVPDTTITAALL
jgi:prepilin-type N-terminal cleavage/methylation domain-containing protein